MVKAGKYKLDNSDTESCSLSLRFKLKESGHTKPLLEKLSLLTDKLFSLDEYLELKGAGLITKDFDAFKKDNDRRSEDVENKLAELIPGFLYKSLTPFEIFVLLYSLRLYEIGMFIEKKTFVRKLVRKLEYFNQSRDFIVDHRSYFGLTLHEAVVIGEICRAQGIRNFQYLEEKPFSIRNYGKIRVSVLAALLRLASALSITTSYDLKNSYFKKPKSSIGGCISDISISADPAWDIIIVSNAENSKQQLVLYEYVNFVQDKLDSISPILRGAGVFYKKIELAINHVCSEKSINKVKNPFFELAPIGSRYAQRFAGRDCEVEQVVEKILGRRLLTIIGESGVGKTSLVEAGVIPRLRNYKVGVVRFSFQNDPLTSLWTSLNKYYLKKEKQYDSDSGENSFKPGDVIDLMLKIIEKKNLYKLLIVGDHLEQLFTVDPSAEKRNAFIGQFAQILSKSDLDRVVFLFCIRQDYLPNLYDLSCDIPELYDRNNTFKLLGLNKENGRQVMKKASDFAYIKLPDSLIERILDDLCYEGEGLIYPPYFQIVGFNLYAELYKNIGHNEWKEVPEELYDYLQGAAAIINQYFDSFLDRYPQDTKPIVGQILGTMVTDYYTKKRVTKEYLQNCLPNCRNLDELLKSLVDNRIVRRSLGEYELIHDFLAKRVIKIIKEQTFLSRPVRAAIKYIEENYCDQELTSQKIAKNAYVSQMHLAALFRKELGKTLNRYLNSVRIAEAKKLLEKHLDPIVEIAKASGFGSLSVFSRKFREMEGKTPIEYRKSVIEEERSLLKIE
jgi:AraC-like DNA-binding protein